MSRQQQAPQSPLFDEDKKLGAPEHYEDAEYAERQPGKETTEAAKVLATSEKVSWTIAEERKLLRRIDLYVCVPMMITYCTWMDKHVGRQDLLDHSHPAARQVVRLLRCRVRPP